MNPRFVVAFVALLVLSLPAAVVGAAGVGTPVSPSVADSPDSSTATGDTPTLAADTPTLVHDASLESPARSTLKSKATATPSTTIQPAVTGATTATTGDENVLHRTTTLRQLPEQPGEFETEMTFAVPDTVTELEIELEAEASVTTTDGFEETADGTYRWTETTDEPTVTVTMPADRRGDGQHASVGPASSANANTSTTAASGHGNDGYTFHDAGDWAIVQVPGVGISLRRTAPVALEETVTVDGPGATGGEIAVFGPVTEYETAAADETIRLAVPDAADLEEDPDDVLEALAAASDRLDVGATSDEVFVVAAPTDADWGPDGVQYGPSDAWVIADAELSVAGSVWLHEYVHARQGYTNPANGGTATETTWLVEAQADYDAALLGLEQGLIEFEAFERFLANGERDPYAEGVLSEPHTWADDRTDYVKGRLVYADLDRQLRLATDGDRTMEDIFRVLNAKNDRITEADFLAALEEAGGEAVRATAERYTQTSATPEMWGASEHETAFDQPVAEFGYAVDTAGVEVGDDPWPVWDQDHSAAGGDSERVLAMSPEKPLAIPVDITNVGDRAGTYDATLQVDGETVAYERDRLEIDEEASERFVWTPSSPGAYDLRVGDERLTVFVRPDSSVTVTDLTVEPDDVDLGETVTATATVEATGDSPGAAVLTFRTPDGISERPVAVAAGGTETVAHDFTFDDEGRYEIAVGDRSATVSVGTDKPPAELEEVPGFGIAVAAISVLAGLMAVLSARRS